MFFHNTYAVKVFVAQKGFKQPQAVRMCKGSVEFAN